MQLELFNNSFSLVDINLYYFSPKDKTTLIELLNKSKNVIIRGIEYRYQERRKIRIIIDNNRIDDLLNYIHKIVNPSLSPTVIINNNIQLTQRDKNEFAGKANRIRNINNRNLIRNTNIQNTPSL